VRRSSDDAEEDFTAAEVADGTLAAFCGAGDGFVKQWWDQSGNARHAVAAADANEPQIVDSGVVVTEEGRPALRFNGTSSTLVTSYTFNLGNAAAARLLLACVATTDTTNANRRLVSAQVPGGKLLFLRVNSSGEFDLSMRDSDSVLLSAKYTASTGQTLLTGILDSSDLSIYGNAALEDSTASTFTGDFDLNVPLAIGSFYQVGVQTEFWSGTAQEIILYTQDIAAQRELIEGNIAWSYS